MSQAGIVDFESSHPQIPTTFTADSGSAIPVANELVIDGLTVANATYAKPVFTTGAGNTIDVNVQVGAAITGAPADKNDAGLVSFDDTMFTVDANGYVQLVGGAVGIDSLTGDDAIAVGADGAGNINLVGNVVANGTYAKPLYFDGDAGTFTQNLAIQAGTAIASAPADTNDAGIVSFHSGQFSVDANGFVELAGGSIAVDSNTGDDSVTVFPDANGNFNWIGNTVANATHAKPVYFKDSATANALDLDVQVGAAITGAPANKNDAGIVSFDDTYFTVDANGYVSQATLGADTAMANFIVDPAGTRAEYTTIAAAYAAASSGDTIGIKEGTYTENLTIDKNINFVGMSGNIRLLNSPVILAGKLTFSGNYQMQIQNIQHQTNADNLINDGGNSINVTYFNCNIVAKSAVTCWQKTGGGNITAESCWIEGFTAAKLLDNNTTTSNFWLKYCFFSSWDTDSTVTSPAGVVRIHSCRNIFPMSLSSGSVLNMDNSNFGANKTPYTNKTFLTLAGTGKSTIYNSYISSGSSVAISIGAGTTVEMAETTIQSTNATAAIDGAGTLVYGGLTFKDSSTITTTTQSVEYEGPSKTFGGTKIGGNNVLQILNNDNTDAASNSVIYMGNGGTSGGDPYLSWYIATSNAYSFGIDRSDSNKLKLNAGTTGPSAGTNFWEITTSGDTSFQSTGYTKLSSGTTAQQPGSPAEGMIRGNTSNNYPEYYNGSAWVPQVSNNGTWTPVLNFGGATTGITYSTQIGKYQRIGNLIYLYAGIVLSSKGTATGAATITGVPVAAVAGITVPFSWRIQNLAFASVPMFRLTVSTINCEEITSGAALTALTDADFANNTLLQISGCYFIT